jgi:selenocysteine lyase/cysteine desulfurase
MGEAIAAKLGDRALFPDLTARVYANHAAVSPLSAPALEALTRAAGEVAREGLGAVFPMIDARERVRAAFAELIGARPEDVGLVHNTTQGVIDVAMSMPWRKGDRIVCFAGEFPTNVTPWQRAAATFDLELVMLRAEDFRSPVGLERVADALEGGARLVAVSAVQFQTGLAAPLAQLARMCHDAGAELFVDAIQAAGVVPLDVGALGVDYLAAGGHKWLMGVEGAGFLYVAPERVGALRPRLAGWLSHEEPLTFLFGEPDHLRYDRPIRARADMFEYGAPNSIGYMAAEVALGLLLELGVPAIFDHVQAYHDALEPALTSLGFTSVRPADPALRSGSLCFLPPDGLDLGAFNAALGERGVAASTPDGHLRFAPHWPNGLGEVEVVREAVAEVLEG